MKAHNSNRLLAILLKINIEMFLRNIIVDAVVMDHHRVNGVSGEFHTGDGVEIVDSAVH